MKKFTSGNAVITVFGVLSVSILPALAADPSADGLLRQMSAKLAASQSFSFEAIREIDAALCEGMAIPEKAKVTVVVQRPDKIAVRSVSYAGTRRFVADGKTLCLLDQKSNHYAAVPMRTSLDGLVEQLDTKYGFIPPLAEFAVSNPYKELRGQAKTLTYLGQAKTLAGFLGWFGEDCHRILLKGKEADAEIWISVKDSLPRQLTATFHREGKPQLKISFSKWNLAAPVSAGTFTFVPPAGSEQIEMWSNAKMQTATKR